MQRPPFRSPGQHRHLQAVLTLMPGQLQALRGACVAGGGLSALSWSYVSPVRRSESSGRRGKLPRAHGTACFLATHLFPLEGHSNWLSYTLVAKKQCGGILKTEQQVPRSPQRCRGGTQAPRAQCDAFPRATCSPYLTVPPPLRSFH